MTTSPPDCGSLLAPPTPGIEAADVARLVSSERLWGIVALVAAGILLGLSPVLVRFSGISADASAFWRVAMALPLLSAVAIMVPTRAKPNEQPQVRRSNSRRAMWMLLAGGFFAADLIACHAAIELTTAGNAILLANLAPVIIGVLGLVGIARRPGKLFWIGLPFAGLGAYFLFRGSEAGSGNVQGDALALLAAAFYAGYLISIGKLRRDLGAASTMAGSTLVTAVLIGCYALWQGTFELPGNWTGWGAIIALGIVVHATGQGLVSIGLKAIDEATGSMILLIQPFIATLLGALLLGDVLNQWHMFGNIAVIAALVIATRSRRNQTISGKS
ncbi:MAG: DMT family transporter [Thalassospira sp.]|uniref:DMT family transporter n=1 Tax=Thalassospira sp. TaxID=1912094 RepID=UPI003A892FB7